ncbi:MAG: hypothetical protein R2855_13580 [Thermomicrobiales bacterium]
MLLEALQHRLQESRGAPARRSARSPGSPANLANTITWSYDLLEPEDQRAFRRLAVFHGGIAVDAAAAVIWNEGISDPLWALSRLDALVQANLLQVSPDATGEPRFLMLQTIQEFAIDALREPGNGTMLPWRMRPSSQIWPEKRARTIAPPIRRSGSTGSIGNSRICRPRSTNRPRLRWSAVGDRSGSRFSRSAEDGAPGAVMVRARLPARRILSSRSSRPKRSSIWAIPGSAIRQ